MKTIATFIIALFLTTLSSAQSYDQAVGIRGGVSSGFTYQSFVNDHASFKALLSFRDEGMQLTGIFEDYVPVFLQHTDHLFFYYGFGGHAGYTRWFKKHYYENNPYSFYYRRVTSFVAGFDAIAGIEYRFFRIPLTIGIDYKPFMEMFGERFIDVTFCDFAFTAKYTF